MSGWWDHKLMHRWLLRGIIQCLSNIPLEQWNTIAIDRKIPCARTRGWGSGRRCLKAGNEIIQCGCTKASWMVSRGCSENWAGHENTAASQSRVWNGTVTCQPETPRGIEAVSDGSHRDCWAALPRQMRTGKQWGTRKTSIHPPPEVNWRAAVGWGVSVQWLKKRNGAYACRRCASWLLSQ
ncbi:hypothetical protein FB451DRAFT_1243296 [Mycena latifolia]|nr:hypothetical protein FB451DRAFT_1243296 [Mycena latifolia]